jgi:hypothetical protein
VKAHTVKSSLHINFKNKRWPSSGRLSTRGSVTFPQIPPTPESFSPATAHPRRGCTSQVLQDRHLERRRERYDASKEAYTLPRSSRRLRSRKPRGMMKEENTEPLRRSKRNLSPPKRLEPPEPSTRRKISESPHKKATAGCQSEGRRGQNIPTTTSARG